MECLSLTLPFFTKAYFCPQAFFLKAKKYLRCHPVIGVYKFYENWSTETFEKKAEEVSDLLPTNL
jgi:hypothetical protein